MEEKDRGSGGESYVEVTFGRSPTGRGGVGRVFSRKRRVTGYAQVTSSKKENDGRYGRCFLLAARYHAFVETIYLGLGTNLGDRLGNLRAAVDKLAEKVAIVSLSDVFESEPHRVGEIQSRYYNMALRGATELAPLELLAFLKSIEKDLGREPDSHNMPRPIDIDILLYGNAVHESPELSIPHPRMHERAFVLVPLSQIAPLIAHPTFNIVIAELEDQLEDSLTLVWLADERL